MKQLGTRLRFELQLSEGQSVFRGEGLIDEVREPPLSATGMHLRITKLGPRRGDGAEMAKVELV